MSFDEAVAFHSGEEHMHKLLHVPDRDNPTSTNLAPYAAQILVRSPLVALGTLDSTGRPWTTLLGGERGIAGPIGQSIIGMKTLVDRRNDPVIEILLGSETDGEVVRPEGAGPMVSGLGIDLENRQRVKLYGRMVAGALAATEEGIGDLQLVVKIEQSIGNCPKYLNKKHIIPNLPNPKLLSDSLPLIKPAVDLLAKADLFFISSSNHELDMDTNYRGGPPGFTRILSNDENGVVLVYPEYSGNRLYQTLGNLSNTPLAGLVFPDFETGNVLYVTGTTEILVGEAANKLLPRTNLAVKITLTAARLVENGLPFRGQPGEYSPYNPPVRLLANEQHHSIPNSEKQMRARLIDRQKLTPTISRFRFHISDPKGVSWKAGQYVALSFQDELGIGYSHMRDDDPTSLNDDFLRTFTVSSPPGELSGYDEFEITIRQVGPVTNHMFRHNIRAELDVPLQGFGGEFFVQQGEGEHVAFVAGGIGITPVLAQVKSLDLDRFSLFWTVRAEDLGLVADTLDRLPGLSNSTRLSVTGRIDAKSEKLLSQFETKGVSILRRRLVAEDLQPQRANISKWYICTGTNLRTTLLEWLKGHTVLYEDFNY